MNSRHLPAVKFSSDFSENIQKAPLNSASGQVLDYPEYLKQGGPVSYDLAEILALMSLKPTMRAFEILATDLSKIAKKQPPWKRKYVHSVYHGWVIPSPLFTWAVSALAQAMDGAPAGVAGSVWVKVLASPDIPEGVLIPASAKAVKCARPGCPVQFIKTHPNQKYHDKECRS